MKRILVVDDEPHISTLLKDALSDEYEIDVAYDGLEAMAKILEKKPHLMIIDFNMNMPALHGISVVEHVLSKEENKGIKFILISGYLSIEQIERWKTMLDNAMVFTKPFDLNEMKQAIQCLLSK